MPHKDKVKRAIYHSDYNKKNKVILLKKKHARLDKQREIIRKAKNKPCADCGIKYNYWVMEFDHVTGVKKYNLNRLASMAASEDTIKKEIEKCEVVCANCHREREFNRHIKKLSLISIAGDASVL